jgi:hypothetical protein
MRVVAQTYNPVTDGYISSLLCMRQKDTSPMHDGSLNLTQRGGFGKKVLAACARATGV